jgi:ABC-type antimicrobial peptide transport system permease subunit
MLIALSNLPTAITVDGLFYPCHPMQGNDCFSIFLPQGRHSAVVTTGDAFSYGISITSFWSSTAIALFAVTAVSLLALMYGILKILKRRASAS